MVVGVIAKLASSGSGSAELTAPAGTWFAVGLTERGLVGEAITLYGEQDYNRFCGDPTPYDTLAAQVTTFFKEGGQRVVLSRTVGPAATLGTRTLSHSSTPVLRIDAANEGPWSARITTQVVAGSDPGTLAVGVYEDTNQVEFEDNLLTVAAAAQVFSTSTYITITDLGAGIFPTFDTVPVAFTTQGIDDRTNITDAIRVAALTAFTKDIGIGAVSIPGSSSTAIVTGIRLHCNTFNRVGITSAPRASTGEDLISLAQNQINVAGAETLGLFAPWVLIPDGAGGTTAIPPDGYVAACRARALIQEGSWRIPAGVIASAQYVAGIDSPFDDDTADDLDTFRVSVIRMESGVAQLYGYRSLSNNELDYYWLKNRDLDNYVMFYGRQKLLPLVFANIDSNGQFASNAKADMTNFLEPMAEAGAFYAGVNSAGQPVDPGYTVDVGSDVNPISQLQDNEFVVAVGLRHSPAASLIILTVLQVPLSGAL